MAKLKSNHLTQTLEVCIDFLSPVGMCLGLEILVLELLVLADVGVFYITKV